MTRIPTLLKDNDLYWIECVGDHPWYPEWKRSPEIRAFSPQFLMAWKADDPGLAVRRLQFRMEELAAEYAFFYNSTPPVVPSQDPAYMTAGDVEAEIVALPDGYFVAISLIFPYYFNTKLEERNVNDMADPD